MTYNVHEYNIVLIIPHEVSNSLPLIQCLVNILVEVISIMYTHNNELLIVSGSVSSA